MKKIVMLGFVGRSVFLRVKRFHRGGETISAESLQEEPGGKGFNRAVAAARFGADVTFIGAVGGDGYENEVRDFLLHEKVTPILFPKTGKSSYACILTDESGANHVTVFRGEELTPADVEAAKEAIASADLLVIDNGTPENVNEYAVRVAREAGVDVMMNPAPYRALSPEILKGVRLFTPNEYETAGLEDIRNVIVTKGKRGSYIKSLDVTVPPSPEKAVDTTGAGDTFSGVLSVMLAEGRELYDGVLIATRAAGKSVTRRGAATSAPYRAEVLEEK